MAEPKAPKLTPDQQWLRDANASYRFRHHGPTFEQDDVTQRLKQVKAPSITCDIIDNTVRDTDPVGAVYAHGSGPSEQDALRSAVIAAKAAAKPMTPAQKADAGQRAELVRDRDDRIRALEADLARYRTAFGALEDGDNGRRRENPDQPSKDELRAMLKEKGIEHDGRANRETMLALARQHGLIP